MKFEQYDHFLIIDLEATCCDKQTIKRQEMEIIEIGAVLVDTKRLAVVDEFQTFIRPVRHPILTDFCRSLTSIQQSEVDSAPEFSEAMTRLKVWLAQYPSYLFCSWGDYDKAQLEQDCQYHREPYPFSAEHLNIKKLFAKKQRLEKGPGMEQAMRLAKLPLKGTHHRGIDDARNMATLMPFILGKKKI